MNDLHHPCEHWAEPISLAAAGCLSSCDEQAVRRQIETCADCREQLRQLTDLCRALTEAPLAADSNETAVGERILSAVTAEIARRPGVRTREEMMHPPLLFCSLDTWSWILRSRASRLSGVAILMLAIGGIAVWFHAGGATPAYAGFIEKILNAKTVTFKATADVEEQKVTGKVLAIASSQRMRFEQELPNGQTVVTISAETGSLVLRPAEKLAIVATVTSVAKENRPNALFFAFQSQLAEARDQPDFSPESLGEKVVDGRRLAGYRLAGRGLNCELWGDPKTGLPVRIESSAPENANAKPSIWSDFVFDAELDGSLFSLEPPAGYQVQKLTPVAAVAAATGKPSVGIKPIRALPSQAPDPELNYQIVGNDESQPVPLRPQTLFRDEFSDLTNSRGGLIDGKTVLDPKRGRAIWPFAGSRFKGRLALIVSELSEAVGADSRPGILSVEWEHVPESIDYSGFRYEGRLDLAKRFMLPQVMEARTPEELRGFKFRVKFKAENENLGDAATIKFDLRLEPVEDRNYDNRLDFGTIEASSLWKSFEIDLAAAKNGERFVESFARRRSGMCALIFAQAGSINDYHDGDRLLIDDIEILDQRPPKND